MFVSSASHTSTNRPRGAFAGHGDSYGGQATFDAQTVEPTARSDTQTPYNQNHQRERRSLEARANANALHLGVAAQMLHSRAGSSPLNGGATLLPLPPMARIAARYASTANGLNPSVHMGFVRTV